MVPKDKQASAQVGRTGSRNREIVTLPRGIPTSYVGVPSPLHDQFRGLGRQDHIPLHSLSLALFSFVPGFGYRLQTMHGPKQGDLLGTGGGAPSRLRSFATRRRRRLFSAVGSFNVFPFTMLFGCYGRASVGRRMLSFVRARGRLPRFRAAVSTGVCATSSLSCLACSATLAQVP